MRMSGLMLLGVSAALLLATASDAVAGFSVSDPSVTKQAMVSSDCDDDDCTGYEDEDEENEEEESKEGEETEETEEPEQAEESE